MTCGIIYRAYNKISKKSYVGQSRHSLELRRREHYSHANKRNHKFANALKCYPRDSWEWSILAEVEIEKLDEYERFFIADLDSYNSGYNSSIGGDVRGEGNIRYNRTVYEVYNPEYGVVSGVRYELARIEPQLADINHLVSGRVTHIKGWVLAKDKETYPSITIRKVGVYSFYHPNYGVINCKFSEFCNSYLKDSEDKCHIQSLVRGNRLQYKGWILAENKNRYREIITKKDYGSTIKLTHPTHGTHELTRKEFEIKFGLCNVGICNLAASNIKSHKGWRLVDGDTSAANSN